MSDIKLAHAVYLKERNKAWVQAGIGVRVTANHIAMNIVWETMISELLDSLLKVQVDNAKTEEVDG